MTERGLERTRQPEAVLRGVPGACIAALAACCACSSGGPDHVAEVADESPPLAGSDSQGASSSKVQASTDPIAPTASTPADDSMLAAIADEPATETAADHPRTTRVEEPAPTMGAEQPQHAVPTGGISLRERTVGEAPSLDPDQVYFLGVRNDHRVRQESPGRRSVVPPMPTPLYASIAPLDNMSDSLQMLPLEIETAYLSRADGFLHYQVVPRFGLNGPAQSPDVLRRFVLDEMRAVPGTHSAGRNLPEVLGDPVMEHALACESLEEHQHKRLFVPGWDNEVYYACGQGAARGPTILTLEGPWRRSYSWYDRRGALVYEGDVWLRRVGPRGRALGQRRTAAGWEIVLLDLNDGGALLATIDPGADFEAGSVVEMTGIRMRSDGFWLALQRAPGAAQTVASDYPTGTRLFWLDLSLEGEILGRGEYAPLPDGLTTIQLNSHAAHRVAIDGSGAAYQIVEPASESTDSRRSIVERPMRGDSKVRYTNSSAPEAFGLDYLPWITLLSGG
ncbi:MAG: hypothetical protein OXU20_20800 [Myxococcales bacterium]|nr:hypothetical protein [Myxococcales bacterium]